MRKRLPRKWLFLSLLVISGFCSDKLKAQTRDKPCIVSARYFYWVGGASDDFFDEKNWRIAVRKVANPNRQPGDPICLPEIQPKFTICRNDHFPDTDPFPSEGALDPGKTILHNLLIEGVDLTINVPLIFGCPEKGVTLHNARVTLSADIQGFVNLQEGSTLRVTTPTLSPNMQISLRDNNSLVYFNEVNPVQLAALQVTTWPISARLPDTEPQKLINQYYQKGSVLRMDPTDYKPLTIYESAGYAGSSAKVGIQTIHSGPAIPGGMDNNIRSFKLKRGFMATLANNANGTGKSQVFIASEKDLEISNLPASLSGNVSFIRVLPWNWVSKKGTGGLFEGNPLNAGWFYTWSSTQNSQVNNEYAPMSWGAGTTNPAGINSLIDKTQVTHLLGFNESDNCSGESGQYLNLCQPDVAVAYYERLMGTGLRLGTPAPRENGPTTWLRQFAAIAKERDVRFDFVAVHWYDWGSNPAGTPNANPQDVFNRFKAYLTQVYNEYQLPIWITEFNANPNRENSVHAAFLQLALPYLESLPYVERYAYFQPNPANATSGVSTTAYYFDNANNLTNIGVIYRDQTSTPSMPDPTYSCANNLNALNQPLPVKQAQQYVFEAECGKYPGSKWTVGESSAASNGKYLQGNTSLAGATSIATKVHFDFNVTEENNFRIWLRTKSTNGIMGIQVNHDKTDTIRSVNSTDFEWISVPRLYSFKPGANRVSLELVNNVTQFDQVAIVAGSEEVNTPVQPAGYCTPAPLVWGQTATEPIFAEAETAGKGASWTVGNNDKAIGGQFVQSGNLTSNDSPPTADGWLTFPMDVTTAGAYQFWAKIQGLETTSNKLWLKIDNGSFDPWGSLFQAGYMWKWMRYDPSGAAGPRQEYLFLEPGSHTFTIAYASGGVKIDRAGLIPAGNSPVSVDPDVVLPTGPQSFEAEEATMIGTPTIVNCATASNGRQVNMGNAGTNGIRFEKVLAASAGTYQLAIRYMLGGTNPRSLRVFVNGTQLATQRVVPSGLWCYETGGTPGTWRMSVKLNAGENNIELRPVSAADAPFIDKIELRATVASLEAELAQLTGTVLLPTCASASNGALANMGNTLTNAVQFNNISIPATGTYNLNITYFAKVARTMRMFVDGGAATNLNFDISGNWCYETPAGVGVIKTVTVTLTAGAHTIRFQPLSGDAPVLDKIDLVDPSTPAETIITGIEPQKGEETALLTSRAVPVESGMVFPNPARSAATIFVPSNNKPGSKLAKITLFDARGAALKSNVQATSAGYKLPNVTPGVYLLQVEESGSLKTYRILVQ